MQGSLYRWLFLPLLFILLLIPVPTDAQGQAALDTLTVQLWPEFDQPAMLVIYDFTLTESTSLPVDVTLRIPTDATLIAVAYAPTGNLLNVPYQEPYEEGGWQVLTLTVDTAAAYHIEYYAPLTRTDAQREYVYLWPGDYAVETFNVSVKVPVDTTEITTDPQMRSVAPEGSAQTSLEWGTANLEAGEQLPIKLTYTRTSDQLSVSNQPLETGVVDESTRGRVSLSNYLPYILGGLGVLLIVGGGIYFWQTSQGKSKPRKRHRSREQDEEDGENIYCHQCGKRAQSGDRFCRTCGTRLRRETS
ncbi:MAG: zinc ribbon domain-containing protein [Anaerolineales bacterium]|nr:zinc ribbon domain-containing protein [Anaerolineales bacterium]